MSVIISNTNIYHCSQCGKEVSRSPSNVRGDHVFCSRSCSASFHNKDKIVIKTCLGCHSDFRPHSGNKGRFCSHKCQQDFRRREIYEKIEQGTYRSVSNGVLRRYLIEKHGAKCMLCGWDKINPTTNTCPVQVDHKDGDPNNNKLENVRLICPNCHSLTPTYMNLNKGRGRSVRRERYLRVT